ncbi:MAG: cobyric acid synthase [Eggerthellaceae bacterium]|jgi:adenosylcobyric acid synthase
MVANAQVKAQIYAGSAHRPPVKRIMVQGTMSGVGKSVLAAGLCRVLARDGLAVAPFKSQNMALNSFITPDGAEIGRAQAMQAEACGIPPEACMNPILLKPTADTTSQVIVNGHVRGDMPARTYFEKKRALVPDILRAYDSLAERFDCIVIEGAGSPAEINLKDDDIVNMGLAAMVDAPVLLVGDIDRGGVFAQLAGTMMLLEPDERARVRGLVVNKFRGDRSILEPGLAQLEQITGVPVAGVVPYAALDLDDEDSLSERLSARAAGALADIAVVRLPRISNFTDFIPLEAVDGVGVRYVSNPHDLGRPDLIIIPGTKSTLGDLAWMRTSGMAPAVVRASRAGVPVVGICGGYQMLGMSVSDPTGAEGGGEQPGLGLLPVETVFAPTKHQVQVEGAVVCDVAAAAAAHVAPLASALAGRPVRGYEIHLGETKRLGGVQFSQVRAAGSQLVEDGCVAGDVFGSYVHGLFDDPELTEALVGELLARKGIDPARARAVDYAAYKQRQYDELERVVRASIDMNLIERLFEEQS